MSKLSTPALSISNNVLTVSNIDDNATSIKLKKDGTDYKTLYTITETITNLTAATHDTLLASDGSLTISLTADGTSYKLPDEVSGSLPTGWSCTGATMTYSKTSDTVGTVTLSNSASNISFTVEGEAVSSGETWVFTSNPTYTGTTSFATNISFVSNSVSYTYFVAQRHRSDTIICLYYGDSASYSEDTTVYEEFYSGWKLDAYKTVTFETTPTGDLLDFLQMFATKQ